MLKRRNGFTIVELLIVIVVIGILAAITIVAFNGVAKKASDAVVKNDAGGLVTSLGIYSATNSDQYVGWFSGNPAPAGSSFKVSGANYADVVTSLDKKQYCVRVFNAKSSFTSAANAYTLEQPAGACALLAPSDDATALSPMTSGWKAVSNSCAIRYDSTVYCWGYGGQAHLGNGQYNRSTVPTPVTASGVLAGKTIKSISSGRYSSCVIASDNQAYCWGSNAFGGSGDGTNDTGEVPTVVNTSGVLAGKTIKSISTNNFFTCAIASDNYGYCWGRNSNGQLGNGTTTNTTVPVAVNRSGVLAGKTLTSIAVGEDSACAIASDGNGYCWGFGGNGRLGNVSGSSSSVPVAVDTTGVLAGKTLKSIASSDAVVCAIASDNNAYCWGYGGNGTLGDGTSGSGGPVAVSTSGVLAGKTVKSIAAGFYAACLIASDDNAYCWGAGYNGEMGDGVTSETSTVPVAVSRSGVLAGKTIKSISVGYQTVCAIASDNNAYCWGFNDDGELGNGTTGARNVPVLVTQP